MTVSDKSQDMRPLGQTLLDQPLFFILGSGRSGSTLLQSILAAHPRLAIPPETHFCAIANDLAGNLDEPIRNMDRFWADFTATRRFNTLGLNAARIREIIGSARRPAVVLEAILAAHLERMSKLRAGEKTPSHIEHAGWIQKTFPEARLIVTRRDARGQIASLLRTPWRLSEADLRPSPVTRRTRLHAIAKDAARWARINGEVVPTLANDPRVKVVSYETLVRDPEAEIASLCTFLGEDFDPTMLERREETQASTLRDDWAPWLTEHHNAATRPVSTTQGEAWRDTLSRREVALIEAVAGNAMRRAGYDNFVTTPAEGRQAIRWAKLAGGLQRISRRLRLTGVKQ